MACCASEARKVVFTFRKPHDASRDAFRFAMTSREHRNLRNCNMCATAQELSKLANSRDVHRSENEKRTIQSVLLGVLVEREETRIAQI